MKKRIALMGIYHESNTFVPQKTTLEHFMGGRYYKGNKIYKEYQNAHHEIGGMIEMLDRDDFELLPIFYAEATPGGPITSDTYEKMRQDLMKELEKVLPVDGILVVPHGAGVSDIHRDMDGHWLSELRNKVGFEIPIVGTLDLHANVSPLMVSSTDALVSYRQNPHVDQRQRGREAANLLIKRLNHEVALSQVLIQVPVAISIEQQLTASEPCKSLYAFAEECKKEGNILSISIQLGFPYADVEEMGTSVIVVSDGDPDLAMEIAQKIENYILDRKQSFVGEMLDVTAVIPKIEKSEKPVLLLDMGDNIGGGGPGNNICIMEALEKDGRYPYFVCIYDPEAVLTLQNQNRNEFSEIQITGVNGRGSVQYTIHAKLVQLTDGNFHEESPRHGGQVNYKMGNTAIVETQNGSVIMLTSKRTPPFSLQQLMAFEIDPVQFDVIVAKGVNAPIAAYAPVCPTVYQVNTPGVTQADMTMFNFDHRRIPLFPFEK